MKHVFICIAIIVLVTACKPQKPWSPYDTTAGVPNEKHLDTRPTAFGANEQIDADIGDVEAQLFINGKVFADSPNVEIKEEKDSRKHLLRANVDITPPVPESLWAEFEIECGRNFTGKPAVVRGRIMADDKLAGSFSSVLGQRAMRNGVTVKVDLLNPFAGQVPDSFLVKIVGDLYLMDEQMDENEVNAETATSSEHSQALRGSLIRVNVVQPGSADAPGVASSEVPVAANAPEPVPTTDTETPPVDASLAQ